MISLQSSHSTMPWTPDASTWNPLGLSRSRATYPLDAFSFSPSSAVLSNSGQCMELLSHNRQKRHWIIHCLFHLCSSPTTHQEQSHPSSNSTPVNLWLKKKIHVDMYTNMYLYITPYSIYIYAHTHMYVYLP